MIIEFDLQGSRCRHQGVFETTGFWARCEPEMESKSLSQGDNEINTPFEIAGYKIFSHFSFAFFHEEEWIAKSVFKGLCDALIGCDFVLESVGFIREVT